MLAKVYHSYYLMSFQIIDCNWQQSCHHSVLAPTMINLTGYNAEKAKGQLKILKYILGAFMLRRTKNQLIESGTLVLPSLTEITV